MRREVEIEDDIEAPQALENDASKFVQARTIPERYVDVLRLFVITEAIVCVSSTTAFSLLNLFNRSGVFLLRHQILWSLAIFNLVFFLLAKLISINFEAGLPWGGRFNLDYIFEFDISTLESDFTILAKVADCITDGVIGEWEEKIVIKLRQNGQRKEVHEDIKHTLLQEENHNAHELNHDNDGVLVEANHKGHPPIVKFPRMIHWVLHNLESKVRLIFHGYVEEEGTNPATEYHDNARRRITKWSRCCDSGVEHFVVEEGSHGYLGENHESEPAHHWPPVFIEMVFKLFLLSFLLWLILDLLAIL